VAIINRTTRIPFTNEVNKDGVATQLELNTAVQTHLNTFHQGENTNIYVDGVQYTLDQANNRYLSKDFFQLRYFDKDKSTRNIYLYKEKGIRCNYTWNTLPFGKDILIDRVQVSVSRNITGNIFSIRDETNTVLGDINITNNTYTEIRNFNLVVSKNSSIRIYNNSVYTKRPLVTLWVKLIHII